MCGYRIGLRSQYLWLLLHLSLIWDNTRKKWFIAARLQSIILPYYKRMMYVLNGHYDQRLALLPIRRRATCVCQSKKNWSKWANHHLQRVTKEMDMIHVRYWKLIYMRDRCSISCNMGNKSARKKMIQMIEPLTCRLVGRVIS